MLHLPVVSELFSNGALSLVSRANQPERKVPAVQDEKTPPESSEDDELLDEEDEDTLPPDEEEDKEEGQEEGVEHDVGGGD